MKQEKYTLHNGMESYKINPKSLRQLAIKNGINLSTVEYRLKNGIDKIDAFILENSYRDWETDRKSTRLNSSHSAKSRMPSSA